MEEIMAKGYWISAYREINDPAKLAAYAELAAPAVKASGGNFLVRGGTITGQRSWRGRTDSSGRVPQL